MKLIIRCFYLYKDWFNPQYYTLNFKYLCANPAIFAVLHLAIIGFAVFVKGFKWHFQKGFFDVDHTGGEHSHLFCKSFFCFCLSFH